MKERASFTNAVVSSAPAPIRNPRRDCSIKKSSQMARIWRAGDLLLPTRATSSCHRCRSRAGWRDRQVLSGCKSSLYHTVISYQSKYARDLDDFARRALYLKVAAGVAPSSTGKEMSPVPRLLSECLDDPTAKSQCEGRPRTLRLRRTADQGRAAF